MLSVAGNKSDMYEYEEVEEKEGMAFAKKHNAIFQITSAKVTTLCQGISAKYGF